MKNKLLSIFVAFVRKTFTKERLLDLIDDLLDIVDDRFPGPDDSVDDRVLAQSSAFIDAKIKEANLKHGV